MTIPWTISGALGRLRLLIGGGAGPARRRESAGGASGAEAGEQVRLLALASALEDRRLLQRFCDELSWDIVFLDGRDDLDRVPWSGFTAIFVMGAPAGDALLTAFAAAREASVSPARLRPAIYVAPEKSVISELKPLATLFEHIELKPLFLSTFKLLVTRARAGQFSAWPALPDGHAGDGGTSA